MGSKISKQEKRVQAIAKQQRIEYNHKLSYALMQRLKHIEDFNPIIHGNWVEYKSYINYRFIEDLKYEPEYLSKKVYK